MQASTETYKHTNPALFYGGAAVVDYYGADNDNYVAGEGFCCGDNNLKTKSISDDSPNYEKLQYYYHSDHLGSASYITNLDGEVVQHIEYVPFGEVFLEERNNTWNTPFLFNGKELDEETGLYYYGARYYNPRISLWYGVDPLAEKYPTHSPYCYTMNNPIMLVDPNGEEPLSTAAIIGKMVMGAVIGSGLDLTVQMTTNILVKGLDFKDAFYEVDWTSVGASAAIGAVGIPGSNLIKPIKTAVTAIAIGSDAIVDVSIENGNENIFNGEKTVTEASVDAGGGCFGVKSIWSNCKRS